MNRMRLTLFTLTLFSTTTTTTITVLSFPQQNAYDLPCTERQCPWDEFCVPNIYTGGSFCEGCGSCLYGGNCTRQDCLGCTDDDACRSGEFCATSTSTLQTYCRSCDDCFQSEYANTIPTDNNITLCSKDCLCESSTDCPGDLICGNRGLNIPTEGFGVCHACGSGGYGESDCVQDWLVSKHGNETCEQLCPNEFECNRHEDCPHQETQYCTKDHKCRRCGPMCDHLSMYGHEVSDTSRWVLPSLPHDGGYCPTRCCGWGQAREDFEDSGYGTGYLVVSSCDESLDMELLVINGDSTTADAATFRDSGELCDKQEVTKSNRSSVVFHCSLAPWCSRVDVTIGLVGIDREDGSVSFVNETAYPFVGTFSSMSDTCGFENFIRIMIIIVIVVPIVCLLCCCGLCYYCHRRDRAMQQERERQRQQLSSVVGTWVPSRTPPVSDDEDESDDEK